MVQSALNFTNQTHRKATSACFAATNLIHCLQTRATLLYTSVRLTIWRLHIRAMASEFKLSATLRGHEEDVSISLSCDFSVTYLIKSKKPRPSSIAR